MTCTRCGSWQSEAGAGNRFCSNCGSTLPVATDDQPTSVQPGYVQPGYIQPGYDQGYVQPGYDQGYDQQGYVQPGYDQYGDAGLGLVDGPPPAPAQRDRDWARHPGTWMIAATALLVAGIVLAAVIVSSGGSDDTGRTAAAANPSTSATSSVPTSAPAPAPVQTVIVVPAAPGTPAVTRTVTVAPDQPSIPTTAAGTSQFADASEIDASYFRHSSSAAYFDSPSHNIGCRLVNDGAQAQCTITDYDFSEPGHDCPVGAGVLMDAASSPTIDCIHGAPYSGATVLGYNESMTFGDFSCVSRQSGITCLDSYGSGFTLSREAYTEY